MSIGNRLLINVLILLALAASLYAFFFVKQEQQYAETQARERIQAFGESMREIVQANLTSEDLGPVKKLLNRMAVFEQPLGMRVVLKSGDLFFQSKRLKKIPQDPIDKLENALQEKDSLLEEVSYSGKSYLVSNYPLQTKGGRFFGVLQIWDYRSGFDAALRAYQRRVFSALTLFYSLTLAIIFFAIQRNVNRPMASLLEEVRGNATGIARRKGHEVFLLKREFQERESHLHELKHVISRNSREKEALIDQLRHSEKLAAIGKFAAGLAHEMGGPLSVIEGRSAQALRKREDPELLQKNLELIASQAKRLSAMIQDVLLFARRRPLRKVPIDLKNLCHQAVELFEGTAPGVSFDITAEGELPKIGVDPDQMQQVLGNLVRNAIQAMPQGGRVTLSLSRLAERGDALPWVLVSVEDNGIGMDEEVRAHLFEPFFSRREGLAGTGLGLSIVYGIIQEHDGKIFVQSASGKGTRFDIYLPVDPGLEFVLERGSAPEARTATLKVLSEENNV